MTSPRFISASAISSGRPMSRRGQELRRQRPRAPRSSAAIPSSGSAWSAVARRAVMRARRRRSSGGHRLDGMVIKGNRCMQMVRRLRPLLQPHRQFHQHFGALGRARGLVLRRRQCSANEALDAGRARGGTSSVMTLGALSVWRSAYQYARATATTEAATGVGESDSVLQRFCFDEEHSDVGRKCSPGTSCGRRGARRSSENRAS